MSLTTIRNNCYRMAPGLAPEVIDSFIEDSYNQISRMDWNVLKIDAGINTLAPYTTGKITCDALGNVAGVGTIFTSAMVGGYMRFYYEDAIFQVISYTSATSIVIANWTGQVISTALPYTIFFPTYVVPSTFKLVWDVCYQTMLPKKSQSYFNGIDPGRESTGQPVFWADAGMGMGVPTTVPGGIPTIQFISSLRIEVYPLPDAIYPLRLYGKMDVSAFNTTTGPFPEDLVEALTLLSLFRVKAVQQPKSGWEQRAQEQALMYQTILEQAKFEDYQRDAHTDKVKDLSMEPLSPESDTFRSSHDVE